MFEILPPWPGLVDLAQRVPLWPVIRALQAEGRGPDGLDAPTLCAAGLPIRCVERLGAPPWSLPPHVVFLTPFASAWPPALRDLRLGPVGLCAEGDVSLLQLPAVAVVGARACTNYGREWARRIAAGVSGAGGVVVSGLAAGVDMAAHLAAEGRTIAVLGQGISARMAGWQRRVRTEVLRRGGLVLSEFPPDYPANTYTFPVRNRIIAGLSRVVVVIEAGERSGTRNTATHARTFDRKVLALPGSLEAPASRGCIALLEEGASVITGVPSVLRAAGLEQVSAPRPAGAGLDALLSSPRTVDDLLHLTGRPYADVMVELGMLELTGRVIRLAGARYRLR